MNGRSATIKAVLRAGRFEIPYRVYENDAPTLICLNGIQQSMAMWQGFVARFASDHRIILFNFPGQGKARDQELARLRRELKKVTEERVF